MGATELSAAISAAEPLIKSLIALGLPGIILVLAAIPTLAIVAVFIMNNRQAQRTIWAKNTPKFPNFTAKT